MTTPAIMPPSAPPERPPSDDACELGVWLDEEPLPCGAVTEAVGPRVEVGPTVVVGTTAPLMLNWFEAVALTLMGPV